MASWKLVLGEQIGSWGCKGKIFRGGNTYEIDDPEVVQAAARVKFVTVLPGDADVQAWRAEQAAAAVAVAAPEPEVPAEDFVAQTGEVSDDFEDPGDQGEMDMAAQLNAALDGDNPAPGTEEPPASEPEVPAEAAPATKAKTPKSKAKTKRKSRAKQPAG